MIYIKLTNTGDIEKYPYSIDDLKKDNPNTSFPEILSKELLEQYKVYIVEPVSHGDNYTKNYIETIPVLINESYYQSWQTVEATQEEIDFRLDNQWDYIRQVRNQYLLESDWTQLEDAPFNESKRGEWIQYRQALRDITKQSDPFNIVWPVKPQ